VYTIYGVKFEIDYEGGDVKWAHGLPAMWRVLDGLYNGLTYDSSEVYAVTVFDTDWMDPWVMLAVINYWDTHSLCLRNRVLQEEQTIPVLNVLGQTYREIRTLMRRVEVVSHIKQACHSTPCFLSNRAFRYVMFPNR